MTEAATSNRTKAYNLSGNLKNCKTGTDKNGKTFMKGQFEVTMNKTQRTMRVMVFGKAVDALKDVFKDGPARLFAAIESANDFHKDDLLRAIAPGYEKAKTADAQGSGYAINI